MAFAYGTLKVIRSEVLKKNEKKTQDSWISIKVYRTESVAGDMGPSVVLMAGKKQ